MAKWYELVTGSLEQKKQYKQAKARMDALPEPYGDVAKAIHHYLLIQGGVTDGDTMVQMFVDHVDLWDRAALDRTPVRDIVGDDPVDFAETFAHAYVGTRWIDKERKRLTDVVDRAVAADEETS